MYKVIILLGKSDFNFQFLERRMLQTPKMQVN